MKKYTTLQKELLESSNLYKQKSGKHVGVDTKGMR